MEKIQKENIVNALRKYCERYESQNRAAASLKDVSAATISQMVNGNWELIKDEMWRNVASQTGYRDDKWIAVETVNFRLLNSLLRDVQDNALVVAITDEAGTGKSFALEHYVENNRQAYLLCCNEYWNRKMFLTELLAAMGRNCTGYTVGEMMQEVVRGLKIQERPLLIFDEADKLSDHVLYFFITLYNQLEDECGIVLCATNYLEKRLKCGIKLNKKGYKEIWSRIGRKCIELKGVSSGDITQICEKNGISEKKTIDLILSDSEGDLRRVKRKVYAVIKKRLKN
jgi:DNA transposition AAA+ family ATPase